MTKDEALKMAIEAMEMWDKKHIIEMKVGERWIDLSYALNACKEALEKPAQEPAAWMLKTEANTLFNTPNVFKAYKHSESYGWIPLYTHPAQQWQGLTDDEQHEIVQDSDWDNPYGIADAIEQALRIKNDY